jgi:hypothetical protein
MGQPAPAAAKSSGLSILWDVVVAPKAAFAALREQPHWLTAFVVTAVLGALGAALAIPANQHMVISTLAQMAQTNPQIAQLTPDQRQNIVNMQVSIQHYLWLAYPIFLLIGTLVTAVIMLVFNAISQGDGNFKRFFALAVNVALIYWGIAYFLVGLISYLRGPDAFNSARDMYNILPSLSWFVPGAPVKATVLLAAVGPFSLWSLILIAFGMQETARIKPAAAWIGAIVIVFGGALIGAAFAQ